MQQVSINQFAKNFKTLNKSTLTKIIGGNATFITTAAIIGKGKRRGS